MARQVTPTTARETAYSQRPNGDPCCVRPVEGKPAAATTDAPLSEVLVDAGADVAGAGSAGTSAGCSMALAGASPPGTGAAGTSAVSGSATGSLEVSASCMLSAIKYSSSSPSSPSVASGGTGAVGSGSCATAEAVALAAKTNAVAHAARRAKDLICTWLFFLLPAVGVVGTPPDRFRVSAGASHPEPRPGRFRKELTTADAVVRRQDTQVGPEPTNNVRTTWPTSATDVPTS
jgi:hypothetical protein